MTQAATGPACRLGALGFPVALVAASDCRMVAERLGNPGLSASPILETHTVGREGTVMWRMVKYVARISGYGSAAISFFLFGGVALIALSDTNAGGFIGFVKYLAILSAFLSSVLIASALKPEDISAVEMYNTVPYPFWRIVTKHVIINWSAVLLTAILIALIALAVTGDTHHLVLLFLGVVNVASNSLLFGGLALLGTVLGRDSRMGQLLGLLVFVLSLVVPLPEFINPVVHPYRVVDGLSFPVMWWISRFGYAILGILAFTLSLYLAKDTDRLIVGKHPRSTQLPPFRKKTGAWEKDFILPSGVLLTPPSRFLGLVIYEALLTIIGGVIPILVLVTCATFIYVLPLFDAIHSGLEWLFLSQVESLKALVYFLFPFLPVFLVDRIPHDRRVLLDQLLFAAISPREYLMGKAVGACVATLGAFLLGNAPALLFLTVAALFGSSHFLLSYLGILAFGVVPALVYIGAISVLVGGLVRSRPPIFLGGLLFVGYIVLLVATQNSIVGNILFPTGIMAAETFSVWLHQRTSIIYANEAWMAVPLFCLCLPIVSGILQIGFVWLIVGEVFDQEVTKA